MNTATTNELDLLRFAGEKLYLSCHGENYGFADNSYHIIISSDTDSTTILDGFTVERGYSAEMWAMETDAFFGGGIRKEDGDLTIANCTFRHNVALGNQENYARVIKPLAGRV